MKEFFKSATFKAIFGTLILISGITLYTFSNPDNIFSDIFHSITVPVQKALCYVSTKASDFSYQFEEKEKLYQENENLKSELNHQRDITVDYYNIKRENERFKKYYDIKESDNSLKFVSASVIGRDQTDIFGDFVLDKGKSSGIEVNDAVITENGIVGRVCEVSLEACRVKSALSPEFKVGVQDCVSGDSGVVMGSLEATENNFTKMMFIPAQNSISPDDIIVTSSASGMYPKNLKVGKVKEVKYDNYECSHYALIELFEDVKNIKEVFVVSDFRGKGIMNNIEK